MTSDWFRLETLDDSLQPTIDMLLNLAIFLWIGAVCPWSTFLHNEIIPITRLIFLGILTLLFRRMPVVFAMHNQIKQIKEKQQALYVGYFGPIGVSAIFYLYISLGFLQEIKADGIVREDAARLSEVMTVVIWFLAICSIVSYSLLLAEYRMAYRPKVVHGLSVPIGMLGYHLPRTISNAMNPREIGRPESFRIQNSAQRQGLQLRRRNVQCHEPANPASLLPSPIFQIGGSVIRAGLADAGSLTAGIREEPLEALPFEHFADNTRIHTDDRLNAIERDKDQRQP